MVEDDAGGFAMGAVDGASGAAIEADFFGWGARILCEAPKAHPVGSLLARGASCWSRLTRATVRPKKSLGGLAGAGFINSSSRARVLASRRPSGVVPYLPAIMSRERRKMSA